MKKILSGGGLSLFALALSVNIAFAAVDNGSFENGTNPGVFATLNSVNTTNITDWKVSSGSVDYIGSYWTASDGVRSIDMNGLAAGSISQEISTNVGLLYTVTFDLSGNPDSRSDKNDPYYSPSNKVVSVSANELQLDTFSFDTVAVGNTKSDMEWAPQTYTFVATGTSTVLTFASQIIGAFGPALDNVVVNQGETFTKDMCKKGDWKSFGIFKNQGDCVSFVATGGKNLPAIQ
jgi:choice-of-anchor C domain-containing protein